MKFNGMILKHNNFIRQRAFTLVELLVSIVVATILITVGIPSFAALFESTRLSTESNNLIISMNLARSEAVKRGFEVIVVPKKSSGWNSGFKVGYDDTLDNDLDDANVKIFQTWEPIPNSIDVSSNVKSVTFKADGSVVLDTGNISDIISLQPRSCVNGESNRRELKFSNTGKVNIVRTTSQDCGVT